MNECKPLVNGACVDASEDVMYTLTSTEGKFDVEKTDMGSEKAAISVGGLHSSTFQLNVSRVGVLHTSPCPPV